MNIRYQNGHRIVSPLEKSATLDNKCRTGIEKRSAETHFDIIVIGTGAGGAAAGTEYAKAGHHVLFLEAGPGLEQQSFSKRQLSWSTANLYDKKGVQIAIGNPPILLPSGRCVGGSTVINSAICFRPPAKRLEEWHALHGGAHLLPNALAPIVSEIWQRLGIVPTHEGNGRKNNLLLQKGFTQLAHKGMQLEHQWIRRNAPACGGCGVCHLGCPVGAKASVDKAFLPEALHYNASIRTLSQVRYLNIEAGSVKGVEVALFDPSSGQFSQMQTLFADEIILAGNALNSPILLERSGIKNPVLGQHLYIHPSAACIAEFTENVDMWNGVPQGYFGHPTGDDRFLIESVNIGAAELFGLFGRVGPAGEDTASRFRKWAFAGAMVRDTTAGGSVHATGEAPEKTIHYEVGLSDLDVMKEGLSLLVKAYFSAGATSVCPLIHPLTFYQKESTALAAIQHLKKPTDLAHIHASHPHGTCRMGQPSGPHQGVTDLYGRVFGVSGLQVQDGSLFSGPLGVNPQVTIASIATANARQQLRS